VKRASATQRYVCSWQAKFMKAGTCTSSRVSSLCELGEHLLLYMFTLLKAHTHQCRLVVQQRLNAERHAPHARARRAQPLLLLVRHWCAALHHHWNVCMWSSTYYARQWTMPPSKWADAYALSLRVAIVVSAVLRALRTRTLMLAHMATRV